MRSNEPMMQAADFRGNEEIHIVAAPRPEPAANEVLFACRLDRAMWFGFQTVAWRYRIYRRP